MPKFTAITLRIALVQFLAGSTLGAVLLVHKSGVLAIHTYAATREAHFHVLCFGWLVQLCVGMSFWILPKFVSESKAFHGTKTLAVGAIIALNFGVLSSFFTSRLSWLFYAVAAVLFVFHIWPRVKPFSNSHKPESI